MKKSSTLTNKSPTLMPASSGIEKMAMGFLYRAAKEVLALAWVLMRIPNQATP
ncbi:MAG: hypothetical protein ACD_73C00488G0004 [uncultured bacterium]|nr:MAG: hypothetical protein ACD_73C00488G0004 [uncultured bacterium]